jgi:hypothetical protein
VWFLEAPGDRIVFLAPEETTGAYAVCETGHKDASGRYHHRHLDLQTAMLRGEAKASELMGGVLIKKSAGWRKQAPTATQLGQAARHGIDIEHAVEGGDPVTKTKGELYDEVAVVKASLRIDDMALVSVVGPDDYWSRPGWGNRE